MSYLKPVDVTIPDDAWEEVRVGGGGLEETPTWTRLNATLRINGSLHHVTAIAVKLDSDDQDPVCEDDKADLEKLFQLTEDAPFYTTTIRGREYVVWVEPYID